jgi:hypothetical protein
LIADASPIPEVAPVIKIVFFIRLINTLWLIFALLKKDGQA